MQITPLPIISPLVRVDEGKVVGPRLAGRQQPLERLLGRAESRIDLRGSAVHTEQNKSMRRGAAAWLGTLAGAVRWIRNP